MLRYIVLLIAAVLVAPTTPSAVCPAGAAVEGYAPPDGDHWACFIEADDGTRLRHGWSVDYWPNGNKKQACEYDHDKLHGRCSAWSDDGQLRARGRYEAGERVGYWWFWGGLGGLRDPDGSVAREWAEGALSELGAVEDDAPALAQHLLEQTFVPQTGIRTAPQVCAPSMCLSAATVEGVAVLAVQFEPPAAKVTASSTDIAALAGEAAAAKSAITKARRKRERAYQRALKNYKAKERRWSGTRLECNDGTRSPSCVCGGGHRGCCSHHGGVWGCPAEYPTQPAPDTTPLVPNEFVDQSPD